MNIQTTRIAVGYYQAFDADNCDGAPDAKAPSNITGRGKTELAAINDLVEQLLECANA